MAKNRKNFDRIDGSAEVIIRKNGVHAGDVLLVILAVLLVAVLIVLASVVVPAVRKSYLEYDEELLFTVEFPRSADDGSALPQAGDAWVLLDSDGAVCTVREVDYSEEEALCRVTLLRGTATYRQGKGYAIESTRIAVGSTLYFRRDPEYYFAASVTGLTSDRFSLPEPADEAAVSELNEEEGEEDHG